MKLRLGPSLFIGSLVLALSAPGVARSDTPPATTRIGTFDSRAVALAFWRGEEGQKKLNSLHQKYATAKSENDEALIKKLEIEGPGLQVRMHQQVFSTGSVTDIMTRLKPVLPEIAKEAGVSLIVPKSQVAYQDSSVQCIDVTPLLVKQFKPTEEVARIIQEILAREPVPIDELSLDPKH